MAKRNIEKHIRLSEKEDDILRRKAEKLNVSVCEYIRRTAVNGKILRYDLLSLHDDLFQNGGNRAERYCQGDKHAQKNQ